MKLIDSQEMNDIERNLYRWIEKRFREFDMDISSHHAGDEKNNRMDIEKSLVIDIIQWLEKNGALDDD